MHRGLGLGLVLLLAWLPRATGQEVLPPPQEVLPPPRVLEIIPLPAKEEPPAAPNEPSPLARERKLWSGSVELGLSGVSGNSNVSKVRMGGGAKRETKASILTTDWAYNNARANGRETEHRAILDGRYEWLFENSPWSVFASGMLEYDEFKAFSIRLSGHGGLGYEWLKNENTRFKSRLGAGGSREIGGPENRFTPEALVGLDFEHCISERQKFSATVDVFPDLGELGEFRAQARVGYEILIDPVWNLTLKLGALNRYDSTPEGRKPNDIEYFAVLVWRF